MRVGAWRQAAGVRADHARADLGGDVDELGVVPGPGVVHEVEAQPARLAGHLRAPGVQAQHEVGVLRAGVLEKGHDPVHLLLSADVLTLLAGPHPAHVHDVGAGLDSRLEGA